MVCSYSFLSFALIPLADIIRGNISACQYTSRNDPDRGPLWYEAEEPPAKKEENKEEKFEFPVVKEAPPPMRKWLKEPTEENAKDYLSWQYKYWKHIDKVAYSLHNASLRYGGEVYPIASYPDSALGGEMHKNARSRKYREILDRVRDRLGFLYFYQEGCGGCSQQKSILVNFINDYNITTRGIAVKGETDERLPFPSVANPALAAQYDISQTPTLLAVLEKGDQRVVGGVAVGVTTQDVMELNLLNFLLYEGVIEERELNTLRQIGGAPRE